MHIYNIYIYMYNIYIYIFPAGNITTPPYEPPPGQPRCHIHPLSRAAAVVRGIRLRGVRETQLQGVIQMTWALTCQVVVDHLSPKAGIVLLYNTNIDRYL